MGQVIGSQWPAESPVGQVIGSQWPADSPVGQVIGSQWPASHSDIEKKNVDPLPVSDSTQTLAS